MGASLAKDDRRPGWGAHLLDPAFWADWASAVGLVALVVIFSVASPVFLTVANFQALLLAAAILIVISIGQAFVVMTAGIDLSLAATIMLAAIVLGHLDAAGAPILLSCLAALLCGALVGVVNGLLITRGRIPDFVVTLGSLSAITGLALILSGGVPIMVGDLFLLRLASGSVGPSAIPS